MVPLELFDLPGKLSALVLHVGKPISEPGQAFAPTGAAREWIPPPRAGEVLRCPGIGPDAQIPLALLSSPVRLSEGEARANQQQRASHRSNHPQTMAIMLPPAEWFEDLHPFLGMFGLPLFDELA